MHTDDPSEAVFGIAGVLAGAGVLTFALFPLVLPIVLLTAVSLLPLLVIPVAGGLLALALVLPWLALRALRRRFR